ncbi:GNAT family N-acetyltransferase [Streptomyces sp. MI02-7b]|uniref:GNAT family N-acetyltransferase n=1 Tax=Streptomyces sp. MI02-7b TaxID=462941 RepID=UPI0029A49FD4|nr:GNAT family N-acetyltransferase [Streptomyces sp. MI02-7b]MDX3075396.1 GNAT family N-acetyltransferase [Streptomyces sp. MI02-7b]
MTQMDRDFAADAATTAFHGTMSQLAAHIPGAYARQAPDGTRSVFTTLPVATLNAVYVDYERDVGVAEAFAKELSAEGLPWSVRFRGEVDEELMELARGFGDVSTAALPLLLWDAEVATLPDVVPEGTAVRTVSGEESELMAGVLVAAFGMPRDIAGALSLPALLDAPNATGFVLDRQGEAVATGLNVLVGDHVGLFNGAVSPEHRRNGYYRALVAARLRHAVASGARHAFTQTSPMSRPLYESLGFRPAETWTYLIPAQGA